MAAQNPQPTEAEIVKFAADVAYNMGSAAAIYKFANALLPQYPQYAQALAERIAPDQLEMIQDLGNSGMSFRN